MKAPTGRGTLASCVGVLVIVLGSVAALIAISRSKANRLRDNERHVYAAMCTLHNLQGRRLQPIRDVAGALADYPGLLTGLAEADTSPGRVGSQGAVPYRGYFFRVLDPAPHRVPGEALLDLEDRGAYVIVAYPADYGRTGHRTYYGNGFGIFGKDTGGRCPTRAMTIKELRGAPEYWSIID